MGSNCTGSSPMPPVKTPSPPGRRRRGRGQALSASVAAHRHRRARLPKLRKSACQLPTTPSSVPSAPPLTTPSPHAALSPTRLPPTPFLPEAPLSPRTPLRPAFSWPVSPRSPTAARPHAAAPRAPARSASLHGNRRKRGTVFHRTAWDPPQPAASQTPSPPATKPAAHASRRPSVVRHRVRLPPRQLEFAPPPGAVVADLHGFLSYSAAQRLAARTGFSHRRVLSLWLRYKALCALSSSPVGVDMEAFRHGVDALWVEDVGVAAELFADAADSDTHAVTFERFVEVVHTHLPRIQNTQPDDAVGPETDANLPAVGGCV